LKRRVFIITLALLGTFAFSQERIAIAVFPFEDMDKVFSENEAIFFYRRFSNEFANRNNNRFRIIPRQDVEKLINTEATFQLSDFSSRAKTAEMQRVLNGVQILSGYIGKIGNKIAISISLFTYPDLEQLPGGVDLDVVNVNELYDKIPEMVQNMQKAIENNLPPPPPPKPPKVIKQWTPNGTIFENYTIYNTLIIFGYNYSPDLPLGFSLGFYGIYTTLSFALPDFGSNSKGSSNEYGSKPYTDQRYEIIDWILGYNVTIIPNMLYLPVGVGIESVKEWRLQSYDNYGNLEWYPAPQWETNLLFEVGLLFRPIKNGSFSPYIFGSYIYIMPEKHSFSIGAGISSLL